jgi:hypothetical protein
MTLGEENRNRLALTYVFRDPFGKFKKMLFLRYDIIPYKNAVLRQILGGYAVPCKVYKCFIDNLNKRHRRH